MGTQYLTREQLEGLYGVDKIARIAEESGVDVQAVIDDANAEADASVSKQVPLPPIPAAIDQVRGAVARLVFCRIHLDAASEKAQKDEDKALAFLQKVADLKVHLAKPEAVDDPATPEDESETGAAFGAAPRRTGRLDW